MTIQMNNPEDRYKNSFDEGVAELDVLQDMNRFFNRELPVREDKLNSLERNELSFQYLVLQYEKDSICFFIGNHFIFVQQCTKRICDRQ